LAEVYLELRGGKQFSMNLSKKDSLKIDRTTTKETNKKNIIKFQPLEEDVASHKKMVNEIKDSIWKKYNY